MRYVNEDIVLRGDEAKQFVYNLHHPNVAKIVDETVAEKESTAVKLCCSNESLVSKQIKFI